MTWTTLSFRLMLTALVTASGIAYADLNPYAGLESALNFRDEAIVRLSNGDAKRISQNALNAAVREAVVALREQGDVGIADRYEGEWNRKFSGYLTSPVASDLGDHRPLSQWLADFYKELESRMGKDPAHQGLLGDIYDLNYAIPVVFAPAGEWWKSEMAPGEEMGEYRLHFVPFASIVTYYGAIVACQQVLKKQGQGDQAKRVCKPASEKLREVMETRIAPKLSDFVYGRANGQGGGNLDLTRDDLVYLSAGDLLP